MKVSLQVGSQSKIEVIDGIVDVNGRTVALYERPKGKDGEPVLVTAYVMRDGESVTRDGGDYSVNF